MRILAFTNNSGSAWWRLQSPSNHITVNTDHEFFVFDHSQWNGDIVEADIVVFQMTINPDIITQAQKAGAKVVYECDDLLTEKIDREEINDRDSYIRRMRESAKRADMVTTSTSYLANKLAEINQNTHVIPNYIDPTWWGRPLKTERIGKIRLGWAGSTSHKADLEFIAPVIKEVIDTHENVQFVYCGSGGYSGTSPETELMYGKNIFSDIPPERREYYLGTTTELWGYKSKTLYLDIAIAPLIDDEFNRCKSNIKWQEYSLNEWAGVYSDVQAYKNIKYAKKAKTQNDFYKQICYLIDNKEEREKLANKAKKEVLSRWTIKENFLKWIQTYKLCLNQ